VFENEMVILKHPVLVELYKFIRQSASPGFEPVFNGFQVSGREFIHGFWQHADFMVSINLQHESWDEN
jgi:hypothetical protein